MSMDAESMSAAIIRELESAGFAPTDDKAGGAGQTGREIWRAVAAGIVSHIQTSAVVAVTGPSAGNYKVN